MSDIYTLAIDPASRLCGVSLWRNTDYIEGKAITSQLKTWSARAADMRVQTRDFVLNAIGSAIVTHAVIELIPKIVEPSVQLIAGAILADPIYEINPTRRSFVSPSSWKAYARRNGSPEKDPKGVSALKAIGWQYAHLIDSDDVADSILLFLTWKATHEFAPTDRRK